MLQDLNNSQLEQALTWLHSQVQTPPPEELKQLNQMEWLLLTQLLHNLLEEKLQSPLH